jgi:hypothetical protein
VSIQEIYSLDVILIGYIYAVTAPMFLGWAKDDPIIGSWRLDEWGKDTKKPFIKHEITSGGHNVSPAFAVPIEIFWQIAFINKVIYTVLQSSIQE